MAFAQASRDKAGIWVLHSPSRISSWVGMKQSFGVRKQVADFWFEQCTVYTHSTVCQIYMW